MSEHLPPTIDPTAARRWHALLPQQSPWLHEEVARRMNERLAWIVKAPGSWCDWDPLHGGLEGHALVAAQFPQADVHVAETSSARGQAQVRTQLARPWWSPGRWTAGATRFGIPPEGGVQMLWANMALHMAPEPQALIGQWHRALAVDGYLMFSCFGPDTLRELAQLYARAGWPAPAHAFTDMHDWGDMLVHAGFADPVMDMERITLTFPTPARLLAELRGLGRNLSVTRFPALRGRGWHAELERRLAAELAGPGGDAPLALTFEIVYGHAVKPTPRVRVQGHSAVPLADMRAMLHAGRERAR
ncbi:biotin synthase [Melaminivora sp.]|uniref:biotin synthase n=1 Tax=Melaminivora sp. TaxID=1933032 RepID=UPI0028A5DF5A|nr:biotin synthase [Melaminivora sp.]